MEQLRNFSFCLLQSLFEGFISYSFFSGTQICYKIFQLPQPLTLLHHLQERDRAQLWHSKAPWASLFPATTNSHGPECCTSGHMPPSPVLPTAVFVALPYLSLICNRLDTPGSPATSGCRNSSPHTGCNGSPQSLPCTHSGRSPGTAGTASPRDHSHRLQGS